LARRKWREFAALGERRSFQDEEFLVRAGQKDYPFGVVESGEVSIIDSTSGEPREVVRHGPNTFVGDIDILMGPPAVISAIASGNCVAYEVSAGRIRRLLEEIPDLSDLLLDSFQMRRKLLEASGFQGVRVFGTPLSRETLRLREFLFRNHVPHTCLDVNDMRVRLQMEALGARTEAMSPSSPAIAP
jgi:thioredoxin reductase (NADPH)